MKIAVIGAGIFGCYISYILSQEHHIKQIDLYEKESSILTCTAINNQHRYHYGYHYPRSITTIEQIIKSHLSFEKEFKDCLLPVKNNLYFIAKNNSFIDTNTFELVFQQHDKEKINLDFYHNVINTDNIEAGYSTEEKTINITKLCDKIKLLVTNNSKINIWLKTCILTTKNLDTEYDFVINCSYIDLSLSSNEKFKYELCLLLKMKNPFPLEDYAFTVVDGNFPSLYPTENQLLYTLSHVNSTPIYKTDNIEDVKKFKNTLTYLDLKKFSKNIIEDSLEFFKFKSDIEIVEHYLSYKVKLKNDYQDIRTSECFVNKNHINVLQGKISTVCDVAQKVKNLCRT